MKTALDFYERGKLKESSADDYNANSFYSKNRFICPECGEAVYIRPSKYANFFVHYRKTDTSAECDRRVDAPTGSIYERIGLPVYLRKQGETKFELFLGCKAISDSVMDLAEKNRIKLSVDGKQQYSITRERFSTENTVLLQLTHIPAYGQKYNIYITPAEKSHALYQQWSNYADGFSNDGALFSVTDNGGKKIRHGDNVYTETEYYWVRRQSQLPGYVDGIDMKMQGTLELPDRKWYVFKGTFQILKEDKAFNFLISYLRENLKVHLLEKKSEFVPLWPPIAKSDEGYLVDKKSNQLFGCIISGNEQPKVYSYSGTSPIPIELSCKDNVLKLFFRGTDTYINVDRKYLSTGVLLRAINKKFKSGEKNEPLFKYSDEEIVASKEYEIKVNYLELINADCVDYIHLSQSGEIIRKKANCNTAITDLHTDEKLIFIKHGYVLATVKIVLENGTSKVLDESALKIEIKRYKHISTVQLPVKLRERLYLTCWKTTEVVNYVDDVLKRNSISIPMIKVMEETFNEISGS